MTNWLEDVFSMIFALHFLLFALRAKPDGKARSKYLLTGIAPSDTAAQEGEKMAFVLSGHKQGVYNRILLYTPCHKVFVLQNQIERTEIANMRSY